MPEPSREALFRYQVVSQVRSRMLSGERKSDAIRRVSASRHEDLERRSRRVRGRTLYRWVALFEKSGIAGLEPRARPRRPALDAIDEDLLAFIAGKKDRDRKWSIPELIGQARETGVIPMDFKVDRTTVYRRLRRRGASLRRRKTAKQRDARRFAYSHRMMMVLADGNHFRAGVTRAKRVALFFLDNATRMGLNVVVGTSENRQLFLRGLYEVVRKFGHMEIIYLDRGPGFIAEDTFVVVGRLGAQLIHGEAQYPEGHGMIERFNQTANNALLDGLDGRPDVDPDCGALEIRLRHYLFERYNHRPHEFLDLATPANRFFADTKPLRFPESDADLRRAFVIFEGRRVTLDNTVPVDSVAYEMPRGYAGEKVTLHRRHLDRTVHFLHEGRLVELRPVDLAANASARRARGDADLDEPPRPLDRSAADLAFGRDFSPVVSEDGGLLYPPKETHP